MADVKKELEEEGGREGRTYHTSDLTERLPPCKRKRACRRKVRLERGSASLSVKGRTSPGEEGPAGEETTTSQKT